MTVINPSTSFVEESAGALPVHLFQQLARPAPFHEVELAGPLLAA
jgi:hypothetical protein